MTEDPDRPRLAAELRRLRIEAGLSTTQLAERLGWSQSKVSKTELGRTLPSQGDVRAWAETTGAPAGLSDELAGIAEAAGIQVTEWRREIAPGRRRKQQEVRALESAASVVRVFGQEVIVGLAQTAEYADAMFRLGRKGGHPIEDRAEIVRARLARQAALDEPGKRFELVMGEAALRRRLIPPPAMAAQLRRLIELSERPNIRLGVIPFDAVERVHQYHGYAVLGDPDTDVSSLVLAETVTRIITVRAEPEVREYLAHFAGLCAAAMFDDQLHDLLHDLVLYWERIRD